MKAGCNSIVPTKLTMRANGRFGEIYNQGDTVELSGVEAYVEGFQIALGVLVAVLLAYRQTQDGRR